MIASARHGPESILRAAVAFWWEGDGCLRRENC